LPPSISRSKEGKITGQSSEIVQEILSRLNLKIDIQLIPWNDGYGLALSEPDVILYSTFRTAEREELFQWVGPIGADEFLFYALEGSDITIRSLEDAKTVTRRLRNGTVQAKKEIIDEALKTGNLKMIIRGGVGLDNIDVSYAESQGIKSSKYP